MTDRVIIAGAGHAAGQATASLRQGGYEGEIVLVGEERYAPYQRPPLSKKYLAGELEAERLHFKPLKFYDEKNVELRLGTRVERIVPDAHTVELDNGQRVAYTKLLLTTGSRVRQLDLRGADLDGVHYLRTIADVDAIREGFQSGASLVVIGGGYIGLEVAAVAAQHDLQVSVIEMADRVMNRVVARPVSRFFQGVHRANGVELLLETGLSGFEGDGRVTQVVLSDGRKIDADLVVVGVGILPETSLAEDAGLACDNGIVVDEYCQTSDDDILAAGDCTNHPNSLLGRRLRLESVHNALEQAKTAAATICGNPLPYAQIPWFWSDQYDIKLQITGLSQGYSEIVVRGDPDAQSFAVYYVDGDGKLIATDAINSPRDFMVSKKLIAAGVSIPVSRLADNDVSIKEIAAEALGG